MGRATRDTQSKTPRHLQTQAKAHPAVQNAHLVELQARDAPVVPPAVFDDLAAAEVPHLTAHARMLHTIRHGAGWRSW